MEMPFTVARLGKPMSDIMLDNMMIPRLNRERKSLYAYCYVDMAHTVMLAEEGIISSEQAQKILAVYREIQAMGDDFPIDPKYDGMVLQFERFLIDRLGEDIGGRMHTGRSRPGHGNAVGRVIVRDQQIHLYAKLLKLVEGMLPLIERYGETIMPGYTHGQHAQPWTFGHYLARWAYMFERDLERLESAFLRTNRSTLEGVALAGTSWHLNRRRTSELLGHDGIILNSHDAATQCSDYPEENAAVLALLMNHIGRLAGDLYLWQSSPFNMIVIPDSLCLQDDTMPQMSSPIALERLRGLMGISHGWMPSICGVLRPTATTDVDMAYGGDGNGSMWPGIEEAVYLLDNILHSIELNKALMEKRADIFWTTSSHLADILAREKNMSFRTAHHVVARLVRLGIERNITPQEVTSSMVDEAALQTIGYPVHLPQQVINEAMHAKEFLYSRYTEGSPNPKHIPQQIEKLKELLSVRTEWYQEKTKQLSDAMAMLNRRVDEYVMKGSIGNE